MSEGSNSGAVLRSFIERIERLEEEKRGLTQDIGDIYREAKGNGFDPKIMREIVRERRMKSADREEREALLEVYRAALGDYVDTPLGGAAMQRAGA
ncbi:MAG: DUF2312 domain-containing protein [Rhodocyclaceae bacterium]|nr:DUF2312 domain-containing protein [Rhodocyclaceae bacterium]